MVKGVKMGETNMPNIDPKDRDKSDKCIDASKMPDIDIAEMIADWQAKADELKKNTAREWYDKQKDVRWRFSDRQDILIKKLLKAVENGDHEDFIRFDPNSTSEWGYYRLVNPTSFKKDSMTTWDIWAGIETKGVKFIVGDLKDSNDKAVQAVRFDKSIFNIEKATAWWESHKDKFRKEWTQEDWKGVKLQIDFDSGKQMIFKEVYT